MTTNREIAEFLWPDAGAAPRRIIRCRHCEARNRVSVRDAVTDSAACTCGACHGALFLGRDEPLTAISSTAYEHGLDRTALQALKAVPGFPALLRWLLANVSERGLRLHLMAGAVACGEDQCPEVLALLDLARYRLDLPWRPGVFLGSSPFPNSGTMGVEDPVLIVNSVIAEVLDDDELTAVLAHELGHLHADHTLYRNMAQLVLMLGRLRNPLVSVLSWPLQVALLKWYRTSELTADRAALLGCRDLAVALRVDLKLAGGVRFGSRIKLDVRPFIRQARELERLETAGWVDNLLLSLSAMNQTHPFAAWRVMHIVDWVEKGNYLDILAGDYPRVKREPPAAGPDPGASAEDAPG